MRTDPVSPSSSPDHSRVSLGGPGGRPLDGEIDLFDITHRGHVRPTNQDHFLLAMVHPQIEVVGTSLPSDCVFPLPTAFRFDVVNLFPARLLHGAHWRQVHNSLCQRR